MNELAHVKIRDESELWSFPSSKISPLKHLEEIVSQAVSQTINPQSQKSWWSYLFCCCRKTKPINTDLLKAEIMKRINVYDIYLQTFPALFDNSSVATCIMNKSGKTVYTNKANRNWIAHALSDDGSSVHDKNI